MRHENGPNSVDREQRSRESKAARTGLKGALGAIWTGLM